VVRRSSVSNKPGRAPSDDNSASTTPPTATQSDSVFAPRQQLSQRDGGQSIGTHVVIESNQNRQSNTRDSSCRITPATFGKVCPRLFWLILRAIAGRTRSMLPHDSTHCPTLPPPPLFFCCCSIHPTHECGMHLSFVCNRLIIL
jgi:hypothetical protein